MNLTGAVLAGGKSARMGRDKALLEIDGSPMALRMARLLAKAGCVPVALVGPSHLEELARGDGESLLLWDDGPGPRHPLRGLAHALSMARTPWLLCCPCDLPSLSAADLDALVKVQGPTVAQSRHGIHPLVAKLPTSWAERAHQLCREGAPAQALVSSCTPVHLNATALRDCNRPEDLKAFIPG